MRELPAATLWTALARPSPRRKLAFCGPPARFEARWLVGLACQALKRLSFWLDSSAGGQAGEKNLPGTPSAPDLCNPTAAKFNFLESSGQRYYYRHYNLARRVLSSPKRAEIRPQKWSQLRANHGQIGSGGAEPVGRPRGFEWGPGKPN